MGHRYIYYKESKMSIKIRIWQILGLLYLLIIFYLFLSDVNSVPSDFQISILNIPFDKVVHFLIYLPFSFLFFKTFCTNKIKQNKFKVSIYIILTGFILSITTEGLQILNPSRSISIFDLFANFAGVIVGAVLLFAVISLQHRESI